jgi:MoaA/NifB/PqqE/SkfB family radical SAM enzyme
VRVLVVHPPLSVARDFVDYPWASDLGAVQLAAVLRQGMEVGLADALALPGAGVEWRGDGRARLGAPVARVLDAARAGGPFDAAVEAVTPFHRPPVRDGLLGETCAGLREALPRAPILLADCHQSGQHYVEAPAGAMLASYPEADAWVKYEAEATVPALLAALAGGGPRPAGAYRGEEADLARLPEPAWDLVDLDARERFHHLVIEGLGRGAWPFPIDGRTLPLATSRGCPYDCLHCSSNPGRPPGAPKTQRRLPPERLLALCTSLVRRHGATRLWVLDEMLNASAVHLDALLDAAEALGVRLEVPNGLRADLLGAAAIRRLRGRVTTLSVSAESGAQRVVDEVVGKRLDLGEVARVAAECQAAGLPLLVHFMIGLPGETAAEVNATLAFALDLRARFGADPAVQFATPLPGTRLAALAPRLAVDDFGPSFQVRPSPTNPEVPSEDLARFMWSFRQRLRAETEGPRKLILNVTYRCNNHCAFCAVGNRAGRDGDAGRQHALLEAYRRDGVRLLDLDGGEPTLHRELLPLVRHAADLGFQRIAVTTNGRLCSYEAFARRLALSGVTTVLVSLHGSDAATHGGIVGVPEAFEQTVQGIRNLVAAAPEGVEVGVNTTVASANAGHLDAVASLVFDLGVRWLNFQFLTPFGRATREQAPDLEDAAGRVRRIIDAWHPRMRIGVVNLPFCFMPGYEAFLAPDVGKLERNMVFVNDEEVNLAAYLAARRVRRPPCEPCPHASCCAGFYEMDDAPEPPWTGLAARTGAGG